MSAWCVCTCVCAPLHDYRPAVELLHLLDGAGPGQALGSGGSGGALPRGGPVHVIDKENTTVTIDPRLPV